MGKKIKDYIAQMLKVSNEIAQGKLKQNKSEILREMLVQISFFQQERLIHLIVTLLFAFLTIFTAACSCFSNDLYYGILYCLLCVLCLALLVPYIHHYYVLENGVQKLYEIYDTIKKCP
ncbi:MAG: hypothetical protein II972_04820 [Elusimicrobiaceae bacterium]|nr:hypothetical protein [Elusimicrobiaceae bacterium]